MVVDLLKSCLFLIVSKHRPAHSIAGSDGGGTLPSDRATLRCCSRCSSSVSHRAALRCCSSCSSSVAFWIAASHTLRDLRTQARTQPAKARTQARTHAEPTQSHARTHPEPTQNPPRTQARTYPEPTQNPSTNPSQTQPEPSQNPLSFSALHSGRDDRTAMLRSDEITSLWAGWLGDPRPIGLAAPAPLGAPGTSPTLYTVHQASAWFRSIPAVGSPTGPSGGGKSFRTTPRGFRESGCFPSKRFRRINCFCLDKSETLGRRHTALRILGAPWIVL
jgi:hypothetical protein